MTPKEFFNLIIGEDSRYIVARYVRDIIAGNDTAMLKLFIEDVDEAGERWRESETDRLNEKRWQEYYGECDLLRCYYLENGMPLWRFDELEPTPPIPVCASFPPLFDWAVEELKKGLSGPVTDLVTDTSTPTTATTGTEEAPEALKSPAQLNAPKGRPPKSPEGIWGCLLGDDAEREETLKKIKNHAKGKKGRSVALIILGCIKANKIQKPTFSQLEYELGKIGAKSGYNNYMSNPELYTADEIEGAAKLFF